MIQTGKQARTTTNNQTIILINVTKMRIKSKTNFNQNSDFRNENGKNGDAELVNLSA